MTGQAHHEHRQRTEEAHEPEQGERRRHGQRGARRVPAQDGDGDVGRDQHGGHEPGREREQLEDAMDEARATLAAQHHPGDGDAEEARAGEGRARHAAGEEQRDGEVEQEDGQREHVVRAVEQELRAIATPHARGAHASQPREIGARVARGPATTTCDEAVQIGRGLFVGAAHRIVGDRAALEEQRVAEVHVLGDAVAQWMLLEHGLLHHGRGAGEEDAQAHAREHAVEDLTADVLMERIPEREEAAHARRQAHALDEPSLGAGEHTEGAREPVDASHVIGVENGDVIGLDARYGPADARALAGRSGESDEDAARVVVRERDHRVFFALIREGGARVGRAQAGQRRVARVLEQEPDVHGSGVVLRQDRADHPQRVLALVARGDEHAHGEVDLG